HPGATTPPPAADVLGDKNIPVLAVAAPITEAQEAAAEAAAATVPGEVEMIKEKKEEGEGAVPATGKAAAPATGKAAAPAAGKATTPAAGKGAEKAPAEKGPAKPEEKKP